MGGLRERRIRLAYLPASLNPGGAERQMLALAERLPRDRFDVEFVVLSGRGLYDQAATAAGFPIRRAGGVADAGASPVARLWHRGTKVGRYISLVRRGRYDIVDAWLYPADVLAAILRPLTGTPVVIAGQRNVDPQAAFGLLEGLVARLTRRLTHTIVANSSAAAEHAVRLGADAAKVRVIRNGVILPSPVAAPEHAAIRAGMGVTDPSAVIIGSVANLLPVKRHDRLLEAFAMVANESPNPQLVLVGEGPERGRIEGRIQALGLEGRVRLHGSVAEPQQLYGGFDVVVQTSEREGLPNALLEGAAAGRPLIASAAGGTSEIVIDGVTGLLVPVNDQQGMVAGLRRLIRDPDLRARFGRQARDHAAARFGMDRFVAEFAALYEEAVRSRRRLQ